MSILHSPIFLILIILLSIFILILLISTFECTSYKIKFYAIKSSKILGHIRLLFISDFHDKQYKDIEKLIYDIKDINPDYVLLGGDFIEYSSFSSIIGDAKYNHTCDFLEKISKIFTDNYKNQNYNEKRIFFSYGNHELRLKEKKPTEYEKISKYIENLGIVILDNKSYKTTDNINISGLTLHKGYYGKFGLKMNIEKSIIDSIGPLNDTLYNIMLFHKPDYAMDFIDYGYDLVLSGHNHGGLIKFGKHTAILSPDFRLFPKFNYGNYKVRDKDVIVTSGLGEHFIKVRLNNKPEIVVIDIN